MRRALAALCAMGCFSCQRAKDEDPNYATFVRAHEKDLAAYAEAIIQGKVAKQPPFSTYPPPSLPDNSTLKVHTVSRDDNNNVYFITNDSFVTFNLGFIYKSGELLGDQGEPQLRHTEHLFGRWWFYKAN